MATHELSVNINTAEFAPGSHSSLNIYIPNDGPEWPSYKNENIVSVYFRFTIYANTDMRYNAAWEDVSGNLIPIQRGNGEVRTIDVPSEYWSKSAARISLHNTNYNGTTTSRSRAVDIRLVFETEPSAAASGVEVSEANVGGSQTVSLSQANPSSVYHIVRWAYAKNGTTVVSGTQTIQSGTLSASWTISDQYASNLFGPSDVVAYGTVTVETYLLNDELIGSETESAVLRLPQSLAAPTVDFTIDKGWIENVDQDTQTQYANSYLQNLSTATITPAVTYKYGATASQQNPVKYATTETDTAQTLSGTSVEITIGRSGNYVITVYAKDTRGYTSSLSKTLTVLSCEAPGFTSLDVHRCKSASDTKADDEGSFLFVSGSVVLDKATRLTEVEVDLNGAIYSETISGTSNEFEMVIAANLDKEQTYPATITVVDNMGLTNQRVVIVSSAIYTIYRLAGGKAVAFGKPAELLGVEVSPEWSFYAHGKEIQKLIMDCAHPVGCVLEVLDDSFSPNESWPWTLWANVYNNNLSSDLTVNMWVRVK